jgi:hypothetical protein
MLGRRERGCAWSAPSGHESALSDRGWSLFWSWPRPMRHRRDAGERPPSRPGNVGWDPAGAAPIPTFSARQPDRGCSWRAWASEPRARSRPGRASRHLRGRRGGRLRDPRAPRPGSVNGRARRMRAKLCRVTPARHPATARHGKDMTHGQDVEQGRRHAAPAAIDRPLGALQRVGCVARSSRARSLSTSS